jgi:hypothetical protein
MAGRGQGVLFHPTETDSATEPVSDGRIMLTETDMAIERHFQSA